MIRKEARTHIELGTLLKKDRTEENRKEIERILKSNRSLEEKIRQIKRIDSLDQKLVQAQTVQNADRILPLRYRFSMIQSVIKKPHLRQTYIQFLFYHAKSIYRFCRASGVLRFLFVPPRMKLNSRVAGYIAEVLRTGSKELLELCDYVLETGWIILTKKEYNLIVVLKRLTQLVSTLGINQLRYNNRNLIDEIRAIESMFLVLNYRPTFSELIISGMTRVLDSQSEYKGELHIVSDLVKELLHGKSQGLSLHIIILGLNMLKYRQYLTLEDLLSDDLGEIVNTAQFACNSQIRGKIADHIQKIKKRLLSLDIQRDNYKLLQSYLPVDESGEVDESLLKFFYDESKIDKKNLSFAKDRDNSVAFAIHFFRAFDDTFFPLLGSRIRLEQQGRVSLFVKEFFRTEFQTIRQVIVSLEKLRFRYRQFPRSRFLEIKRSIRGAIGVEAEIIQEIHRGITTIRELGKKIEWILSSRTSEFDVRDKPTPLDLQINEGKPFTLPYEFQKIASDDSLSDKSVEEALLFCISICFIACVFFHDQNTMDLLEQGEKIKDLIDNELAVVKRIAETPVYDEIVRMLVF
jgi:hypothetical protein